MSNNLLVQSAAPRLEEPFRRTLGRNVILAAIIGAAIAIGTHHPGRTLPYTILALWFSLGGHYVEVMFLNRVRPRLPENGPLRAAVRIGVWLAGGCVLFLGMAATARVLTRLALPFGLAWVGGLALVGIELVVHAVLALRREPSFYGGTG